MTRESGGIMVFAEQRKGVIHRVAMELLGKARQLAAQLDCQVSCVVLGRPDMDVGELIWKGADKVLHVAHETAFEQPDEMIYADNIVSVIRQQSPEICLFGATSFGRSLAPRVAAALGTGLTADCTGLEIDDGQFVQIRPAFSENILAHIWSDINPKMATVRYKEFDELAADRSRTGQVQVLPAGRVHNDAVEIVAELNRQAVQIADAGVVVSAGLGIKSQETMGLVEELAALLGGMVGASRALVETGAISKDHQVGYSGSRVKPGLYIACGISGAPQHLAGMKDSGCIVAINSDPSAPIFGMADYGIVGDAQEILPQLISAVRAKQGKQEVGAR